MFDYFIDKLLCVWRCSGQNYRYDFRTWLYGKRVYANSLLSFLQPCYGDEQNSGGLLQPGCRRSVSYTHLHCVPITTLFSGNGNQLHLNNSQKLLAAEKNLDQTDPALIDELRNLIIKPASCAGMYNLMNPSAIDPSTGAARIARILTKYKVGSTK